MISNNYISFMKRVQMIYFIKVYSKNTPRTGQDNHLFTFIYISCGKQVPHQSGGRVLRVDSFIYK